MIIKSKEKKNKKYYDEIMYIASNYYVFKKNPKARPHSLTQLFFAYLIIFVCFEIICFLIPSLFVFISMFFVLIAFYLYYYIEAKYRLREYLKNEDSIIKIDEEGIESIYPGKVSSKLYWDSIEHIIINKHSISILPYQFSSIMIFVEIGSKDEFLKALKQYDKLSLIKNGNQ